MNARNVLFVVMAAGLNVGVLLIAFLALYAQSKGMCAEVLPETVWMMLILLFSTDFLVLKEAFGKR